VRMLTTRVSEFCGAAGSMAGLYFRIGEAP
jgi:hypothetical protein